jgi:type II secretory pathway pseudopilin PulG
LLEVLAVVTLMGILALIVIPRFSDHAGQAKGNACAVNKGNIEVQAQLWFRNTGNWPAADLSDIRTNRAYFPAGLPSCPMDGSAYGFDRTTQRVPGHQH